MAASVDISSSLLPFSLSANHKKVYENTLFHSSAKTSLKPFASTARGLSVPTGKPFSRIFSATKQFSENPFPDKDEEDDDDDELHEECGVVGIFGDPDASRLSFSGLHALQHRGHEGAGIVSVNQNGLDSFKGLGVVTDVFDESKLDALPGDIAIGHVRYSTAGGKVMKNVQPFVANLKFGQVAVAHNGNFVNNRQLRSKLEENSSIFVTSSDTEVVLHLIATSKAKTLLLRILEACEQLQGAYSLVFATEDNRLVAIRDPFGFRPLVMGRRSNGAVVFASETCALYAMDAKYEREVFPGEMVVVDKDGVSSMCMMSHPEPKQCVFEHIYFSHPHSVVFGHSVYKTRKLFGEILATVAPVDCDMVIPVPDSGTTAALGYAAKAGVPFEMGLQRSTYAKRTFIEPTQQMRDAAVKRKLSPIREVIEGKRLVMIDDSIVRGTTSSKIVRMLKEAGAKEVHMRIACPPIIASCYYGVDTPRADKLVSNTMSLDEIRDLIGCDSLAFLPLESLKEVYGAESNMYCYACFSGNYPVLATDAMEADEEEEEEVKKMLERSFNGEGLGGKRGVALV